MHVPYRFQRMQSRPASAKRTAVGVSSFSPDETTWCSDRSGNPEFMPFSSSRSLSKVGWMTTTWIDSRAIVSAMYWTLRWPSWGGMKRTPPHKVIENRSYSETDLRRDFRGQRVVQLLHLHAVLTPDVGGRVHAITEEKEREREEGWVGGRAG